MCGAVCVVIEQMWKCSGCGSQGYLEEEVERPPLDGAKLLELRTEFGWSRNALSKATGLTISRICRIEKGQHIPTPGESRLIEESLFHEFQLTLNQAPSTKVNLRKSTDPTRRTATWGEVTRGDLVQVNGESGAFRFLYHHVDPNQEYIGVFGPVQGKRKNPHAPHLRSFTPERVRVFR
jgi:transcriptional regulator with XRE-family HTH domain